MQILRGGNRCVKYVDKHKYIIFLVLVKFNKLVSHVR